VEIEVVTFTLASERYAIESRFVLEVLKLATVTPLPRQRLLGVINLHGDILAVFDLRELLGVPTQGISDLFRIMVLGQNQPEFGVLTDTVDEVRMLRADAVLAPPGGVSTGGHELMRGVTSDAMIVLDGELLLTDERFYVDEGSQPRV
jgi:purine-binding chemotaxis protein CheW